MIAYIIPLSQLRYSDIAIVGGKNASLGEMISQLANAGVKVPDGFATTAAAFKDFLHYNQLDRRIIAALESLDVDHIQTLEQVGREIRSWICAASFQPRLEQELRDYFAELTHNKSDLSFAVRSSATAEDLPNASFAGQQETFLNINTIEELLLVTKRVFASLYNDRAIAYRVHQGFAHHDVALSVGIQTMVRSDCGASGVLFTLDTESGFDQVVFITSNYGLGETVVQGAVNPDEFYVFKPALLKGDYPIVRRTMGSKMVKMVFADESGAKTKTIDVPDQQRDQFSLSDEEIILLARYAVIIEQHYGCPMDIEWAKDGKTQELYIVQARPETVKSQTGIHNKQKFKLKTSGEVLVVGRAIGQKVGSGPVRVIRDPEQMNTVQTGDVLVADMTDPYWEPVMKRAAAIITNRGGRTCHAAIIARELGVPAVVGCGNATECLQDGEWVTVSCAEGDDGKVYKGVLETEISEIKPVALPKIPLHIMMNVGNPQLAFDICQIPNAGVGLARLEFIINNYIGVHPQAILEYPQLDAIADAQLKSAIDSAMRGYASPSDFYISKLSEGIATIAAAFYPKPVIVRLSDFKSNEYKKLIGGARYEPDEENPMLGFRGASRYLTEEFAKAFAMECEAVKRVRELMGLDNVEVMIPFVRTVKQAQRVVDLLAHYGLKRGEHGLRLITMCEIPSNVILAEAFLAYFDGFSIGSNDLTQLTLGLDRDSGIKYLIEDFDERDPAVQTLLARVIQVCRKQGKYIGICGQGPSDYPDFARWLQNQGISSLSLNPDTLVDTWVKLGEVDARIECALPFEI